MPPVELPDWVEEGIRQAGDLSLDRRKNAWQIIAIVGEIVNGLPARSKQRTEAMRLLSMVAMVKKNTQHVYARLWTVLKEGAKETGEVRIPQNIHPSTARCIIQHGGDYALIAQADAEGWTLAQARAWAATRTVVRTDRPTTLWRWLTKRIPPEFRRATGPVVEGELLVLIRAAVLRWNDEFEWNNAPPNE